MAGALFSMFFLLTLYMQEVLHYSAIKTGVAYVTITLTIVVFSGIGQALVTRLGVRRVLPVGLALSAASLVLYARLPVDGHYFFDLFPGFLLSGVGLALSFVSVSIGGLTGVRPHEAGVASGLLNTSQQIGGAIGLAAATTISTIFTNHYVSGHPGTSPLNPAALTHGFQVAFYVLAAIALVGVFLSVVMLEAQPREVPEETPEVLAAAEAA
jgi:MFS family permease